MYIIIIVIIIILFLNRSRLIKVHGANYTWHLSPGYSNMNIVKSKFDKFNENIMTLLRHLKRKYVNNNNSAAHPRRELITRRILTSYNPERIYENDPRYSNDTAYTIGKGDKLYMCMREKNNPEEIEDDNTILYAGLHEISHNGDTQKDHSITFWETFKFILTEAISIGIYKPINYGETPTNYCGLEIVYCPYFDSGVSVIN